MITPEHSDFERKSIFITGLYKCGTTWLSLALGKHPQAMAVIELDVIRAFANEDKPELEGKEISKRLKYNLSVSSYGLLPQEIIQQSENIGRNELFTFYESNVQKKLDLERSFIDYRLDRTAGAKICGHGTDMVSLLSYWNLDKKSARKVFVDAFLEPDPRKAIRSFCKIHQEFSGGFCVFKSADQINHIKHLHDVMPGSLKILIIRDGRDMAISATKFEDFIKRKTHFAELWQFVETDYWERLRQWKSIARSIHTYQEKGEIYVLRYEDLINDFNQTIIKLLNYLGMDSSVEIVERMRIETTFETMSGGRARGQEDKDSSIRNGVIGEWKQVLNELEKQKSWELAKDELTLFGYAE